eukprot:CAMPEP_0114246902 /NCGR_PEP_ID=MMETSP0058-20121206/12726_1 /TAXON_ID=36894 /ORGANISM="Pyramimonas parkeae, CCMP726" /LENGTH=260 /DNA_ID=CAMNT_0001360151 /DNA_START=120 /DNA_END=899 /DNA_ORIENTATION=+
MNDLVFNLQGTKFQVRIAALGDFPQSLLSHLVSDLKPCPPGASDEKAKEVQDDVAEIAKLQQRALDLKQRALAVAPQKVEGDTSEDFEVYIDRSPKHFQAIVDIYHGLSVIRPPPDVRGMNWPTDWIEELSEELDFYCLPPFGPGQCVTLLPPDLYRYKMKDLCSNIVDETQQQYSALADKILSKLATRLADSSKLVEKINLLKSTEKLWTHQNDVDVVKPTMQWVSAQVHGEESSYAETFFITIAKDNEPHLLDMDGPW